MNKYLVAIHDLKSWSNWIHSFNAISLEDCEDKLIEFLSDYLKKDELRNLHYTDFLDELDKCDICISEITDIEEL